MQVAVANVQIVKVSVYFLKTNNCRRLVLENIRTICKDYKKKRLSCKACKERVVKPPKTDLPSSCLRQSSWDG